MRPRLLDLFCGAGGAGMGYHRAGFEVVGVDILPQPHYPFEFHQADALTVALDGFDAIHASPPCQSFSTLRFFQADPSRFNEADCLPPIRERLRSHSAPHVIENVPSSPGPWDLRLCGTMFGLRVKRHRYFAANWPMSPFGPCSCRHGRTSAGLRLLDMTSSKAFHRNTTERTYVNEMGVTWAPLENRGSAYKNGRQKLAQQAIPPAYTEWIGRQLMAHLQTLRSSVA